MLKSGIRRTAAISAAAVGAGSLTYFCSSPDTKEALQASAARFFGKLVCPEPSHDLFTVQGAVVHAARRAAEIGEAGTALFRSLSAALATPSLDSSRQSMLKVQSTAEDNAYGNLEHTVICSSGP